MAITNHAWGRIWKRLAELGLTVPQRNTLKIMAICVARESKVPSEAVRICKLAQQHNRPWSNESNGDTVWAIVRDRDLVTIMFRRSTQPSTRKALRVAEVRILA